MRTKFIYLLSLLYYSFSVQGQEYSKFIIVDQFGYLPGAKKIAVIKNPQIGFDSEKSFTPGNVYKVIEKSSGSEVFTGSPVMWNDENTHSTSGDKVWHFDFTELTSSGTYFIADEKRGYRSYDFIIADNVYNEVLKHAVRTFFYQRAGFPKEAQYAGTEWADEASHIGNLQDKNCRSFFDKNNPETERDVSGGWYDAGDYNKYTSWTANYVVEMMKAYLEKPGAWSDDYNIPKSGNGIPDLLDEAKWGIDHLLRLQLDNGSVLSIVGEAHASPPSSATGASYYGPVNTSTTLNTASALAISSKVFRSIGMEEYADTLLSRAEKAWQWAELNPDVLFNNNDPDYNSEGLGAGKIEVNNYERGMIRLEAACFLFEATGDVAYRDYFDLHYRDSHMMQWNYVFPYEGENQEILIYYSSLDNSTPSVADNIRSVYKSQILYGDINLPAYLNSTDPYFSYLESYTWGSNGVKSSQGNNFYNLINFSFSGIDSTVISEAAQSYIHYIHGVNPMNFLYLSNMYNYGGDHGVNEFYHSWFTDGSSLWDRTGVSLYGPPPGYLTGGANPSYDWDGCCPDNCGSSGNNGLCLSEPISPPKGQPAQKSYKDFNTSWPLNSWSVTENSCGYQVRYIRLLSKFVNLNKDCSGQEGGTAFIDSCGQCAGGNTGITPSLDRSECNFTVDCAGVENGAAFPDSCEICSGENTDRIPVLDTLQCIEPPAEYRVFFHISDNYTHQPLWSVNVEINGMTGISDQEGNVDFKLEEGQYDYSLDKLYFASLEGALDLSSDTIIEIFLIRTHASVKFRLREGTTPVNGAKVNLNTDSLVTNSLGIALFGELPVYQNYNFRITAENYEEISGVLDLISDTTLNIEMKKRTANSYSPVPSGNFKFWPNPASEFLFLSLPDNNCPAEIRICSLSGQVYLVKNLKGRLNQVSINTLSPGLYLLEFIDAERKETVLFKIK